MAKKDQDIWIGLAHVKNMGVNRSVGNGDGAQTYIAIRANDAEEFEAKVIAIFRQNNFQVLSLDNVEIEYDVPKDESDPVAAEKIALFKRLATGALFAWGSFYPYGEKA
ncbi:hypothetical protein [Aureispira sp. CCB-QB1]|uniref:hypothetical protein n=1 Tax=Aureispira sp. CCB-QB1 TaxID=1313421 RepID=UPI00069856EA|nr:hypothetical protein [Aureispira sp. CCB-QB1]